MSAAVLQSDNYGPGPALQIAATQKNILPVEIKLHELSPSAGCLSPDIKSSLFAPQLCSELESAKPAVQCVGKYFLFDRVVPSSGSVETCRAVDITSRTELTCRILPVSTYRDVLGAYWQSGCHKHIANIEDMIVGASQVYVMLAKTEEDLHSYIRRKRRLREWEACHLFRQIVSIIKHCHKRGIVLRDLKLRKFSFIDAERTHLVLDGLEDAVLLHDEADDRLTDKHGCPAYVSPEILTSRDYSGRAADMWSLGVILYTMLFGQYPFHDPVASQLFGKIRRGHYSLPDTVTTHARCLIRCLLRTNPCDRLTIRELASHPWFSVPHTMTSQALASLSRASGNSGKDEDQKVPEILAAPPLASYFSAKR